MSRPRTPLDLSHADTRYLSLAGRAARAGGSYNHRLGAVAVRGGSVLGFGTNKHRNIPSHLIPRSAWSTHAEQACLRQVGTARNATLYISRVLPSGATALARPCPRCWNLAYEAGVSKLVYTTNTGVAVERIYDPYPLQ